MSFGQSITTVFRKYAEFTGRASRSEYWWWFLFSLIVSLATGAIWDGLSVAWSLAILLPSLAVAVRRLRDAGYHWGWLFLLLVPLVGAIIVIVFLAQPSKVQESESEMIPGRLEPEV